MNFVSFRSAFSSRAQAPFAPMAGTALDESKEWAQCTHGTTSMRKLRFFLLSLFFPQRKG
jgi:hypothetical protein